MKTFTPLSIVILALCALGLWGCGQQKAGAINAKIQDLEARHAKLEDDFRALQAKHEAARKRLGESEEQRSELERKRGDLTGKLDGVIRDRENFRKQMTQRTQERDHAQSSLVQFSKDLQDLAGRVEAALNNGPTNPAIIPASRRSE